MWGIWRNAYKLQNQYSVPPILYFKKSETYLILRKDGFIINKSSLVTPGNIISRDKANKPWHLLSFWSIYGPARMSSVRGQAGELRGRTITQLDNPVIILTVFPPPSFLPSLHSILFYSVLFYSILFYSILFYSILFYSILSYPILSYSILFHSIPFHSTSVN